MAALTSLIHVSTASTYRIAPFFVAVSEVEPFISHVDALVSTLEGSNPEKQYFRALVELARATAFLYNLEKVSENLAYDVRQCLLELLRTYRYVPQTFIILEEY